jgi:hypothetical protein
MPTQGKVHESFSGMRAFLARKKSRCILIENSLVIAHDTLASTLAFMLIEQNKNEIQ